MKSPIDRASIPYECSSDLSIKHHSLKNSVVKKFSQSLDILVRSLGEEKESDFWRSFINPLKKYRYNICTAPLPFSYLKECDEDIFKHYQQLLSICSSRHANSLEIAKNVVTEFEKMSVDKENYLINEIKNIALYSKKTGLLIHSDKNYDKVQEIIKQNKISNVEVVVREQLRRNIRFDSLIYIGKTSLLESDRYIFSSPKANCIYLLRYSHQRASVNEEPIFLGNTIVGSKPIKTTIVVDTSEGEIVEDEADYVPTVNVNSILEQTARISKDKENYELAKAKLYTLSGSIGVFLEADSESNAIVINPSEESERLVRSLPTKYIRPGMYIVLRTSEDSDYILPIADRILGKSKERLRTMQAKWKSMLKENVKQKGLFETCLEIIDCGSTIANETNLRNWISPRGIKTQKKSEFQAIMKYLNLHAESESIWADMVTISKAHRSAGFSLKKEILNKVGRNNMENADKLEQFGHLAMHFEDIGTLTAFRVNEIAETIVNVPYSKLRTPFDMEDTKWQE